MVQHLKKTLKEMQLSLGRYFIKNKTSVKKFYKFKKILYFYL